MPLNRLEAEIRAIDAKIAELKEKRLELITTKRRARNVTKTILHFLISRPKGVSLNDIESAVKTYIPTVAAGSVSAILSRLNTEGTIFKYKNKFYIAKY